MNDLMKNENIIGAIIPDLAALEAFCALCRFQKATDTTPIVTAKIAFLEKKIQWANLAFYSQM